MPADRRQHAKLHCHSTESSPGSDTKTKTSSSTRHRGASRSSLGGRVVSGVAGILHHVFEYATPSRNSKSKSKQHGISFPTRKDMDVDSSSPSSPSSCNSSDAGGLAPHMHRMHVQASTDLSPPAPFVNSSPWMAMVARQCQSVLDSTAMKKKTPPRPARPELSLSISSSSSGSGSTSTSTPPIDKPPFNGLDNAFEYPPKPKDDDESNGPLQGLIRAPPPPRWLRTQEMEMDEMDVDVNETVDDTPTKPRPGKAQAAAQAPQRHSTYSTYSLPGLGATTARFLPDTIPTHNDTHPLQFDLARRAEGQLHYFHEIMPHICAAFVPVPPSSAAGEVAPQHLMGLYPPLGKGEQTAFTHIVRILYADEGVGLNAGEGWVERYDLYGRVLDVLKLVVPRDLETVTEEKKDGESGNGVGQEKPKQTTLTKNQLHLARDFLSLAKPCDEVYQLTHTDGEGPLKEANQLWRDFAHTLICAPLDVIPDSPVAAATTTKKGASAHHPENCFTTINIDPATYTETPPPTFSSCIGEPTDQQRRNVLSIIVTYLAFASNHPVQSVWSMLMFVMKGEYHGLLSAARMRGPRPLRDDRDTMRLWMGHAVASATGRRDSSAMPKDRVLGVEAVWPGWEVMRDAVGMY